MYGRVCVCVCDLVWFRPPGSGHTESVNLSEIFSFGSGSGSILSIVPRCAPNICIRRICVCDCLDSPSHDLCRWPRSHAQRIHPFYGGSALVLLLVIWSFVYICARVCIRVYSFVLVQLNIGQLSGRCISLRLVAAIENSHYGSDSKWY